MQTLSSKPMITNPYDGSRQPGPAADSDEQIQQKIARAFAAYQPWQYVPLDERIRRVRIGLERFASLEEEVCTSITQAMGKPLSQAHGEFKTMMSRAEQAIADSHGSLADDVIEATEASVRLIRHQPIGVVFDIAAWNYPLVIAVNVVVPALLAGNTVLIKHAQRTAQVGLAFERAFGAIAEDLHAPGLVQALTINHDQAAHVIHDPRIGHVVFTGSVEGGRTIQRVAADRFISVNLELGGKDPAYVAPDANVDQAAESLVDGACYNAGQSCCGIERVYVHRDVYDAFLNRAAKLIEAYRAGDPMSDATTLGPLASPDAPAFLQRQIDEACAQGARLVTQCAIPESAGWFFPTTLLADVPQSSAVMREESFGPILPVAAVDSDEQAIELMNDSSFGLTASVWTGSHQRADLFANQLNAGTVFQNRCDFVDPALPWTGWGDSGRGSSLSRYGFHQLTRRKSIHLRR